MKRELGKLFKEELMLRTTLVAFSLLLVTGIGDAGPLAPSPDPLQSDHPKPTKRWEKEPRSTRAYQLPQGKAEILASFLKELKGVVMETKIKA
jgi:hypothetical protein